MQFHNALESIAGSRVKARIVSTLAAFPSRKWTGRSLALTAGFSQPRAWRVLHELSAQGVVFCERAGRSEIWTFNERHLFAQELMRFARARQTLAGIILKKVREKVGMGRIERLILFGSVARGEEKPESDMDILVVLRNAADEKAVKTGFAKVESLLAEMTGNAPRIVFYSEQAFTARRRTAFIEEAVRDGLVLYQRGAIGDGPE